MENVFYGVVIGLIILAAVVLVLMVLVQKSKGGGLASGFSSSNQIMGVRKTTDFVEKATWGLAGAIVVLSLVSTVMLRDVNTKGRDMGADIETRTAPVTPADVTTPLPGAPAPTEIPQGDGN